MAVGGVRDLLVHPPPGQRLLLLPLSQTKDVLSLAGKRDVQAVPGGQGHVAAHRLQVEARHHLRHLISVGVHGEEGRYVVVVVVGGGVGVVKL